jgi:hypothetical protein
MRNRNKEKEIVVRKRSYEKYGDKTTGKKQ